jgi:FMNH2-dependent dimethyl sulfone monooxygenase
MSLTFGIFCPIHSGGFTKRETVDGQDPTWAEARAVSLQAEALGFEYNLIAARWFGAVLEPYTTTAALASITTRMQLLVAVQAGLVQPQVVAKIGANIDQISGGRFHVNLVSGSDAQQFQQVMYGGLDLPHDERYALSEEFVRVLTGMWTTQPYSHSGKYFRLVDVDLQPKPVRKPAPMIFLGGSSIPARDVAARVCDWFFISGYGPDEALELKADVERRAAAHGRRLRFGISGMIMIRDSNAQAESEIADLQARAVDDRTVRIHVNSLKAGLWGTPDRIAERLAELSGQGFELALFQSTAMREDLTRFGDEVVPLLPLDPAVDEGYLTVK